MKALIITEKISREDEKAGYFHSRLLDTPREFEKVTVICLEKKEHSLPESIKVISLGKDAGKSRMEYLMDFYKDIWRERGNYDSVFVHSNPIYVVLGGILWKLLGKKIVLWYNHSFVDWKLVWAEKLVDIIATGSKEGVRIHSPKIVVMEGGLDIKKCLEAAEKK